MSQAGVLNVTAAYPSIPTLFIEDSGSAIPIANTLNILGGAGITTSGSGSTVIITSTAGSFSWHIVTSADNPVNMTAETGYIVKGVSAVNFVLSPASAIGDSFIIIGTANLWTISQNAGQSITIGKTTSTAGIFGSVSATMISDGLELVCITANQEFYSITTQGNPQIV